MRTPETTERFRTMGPCCEAAHDLAFVVPNPGTTGFDVPRRTDMFERLGPFEHGYLIDDDRLSHVVRPARLREMQPEPDGDLVQARQCIGSRECSRRAETSHNGKNAGSSRIID